MLLSDPAGSFLFSYRPGCSEVVTETTDRLEGACLFDTGCPSFELIYLPQESHLTWLGDSTEKES